ncbi:MAG: hypothetical protein ACRELY_08500, partial [Polyangiaceae bacterium]
MLYRNGVGYFERAGHVDEEEVRFKMKETEVGDFLATLAVIERGGSSVKAAAFPVADPDEQADDQDPPKPRSLMTEDEKKHLKIVVLSLDGKEHDLEVGYIAASPVWRPSYRLVVHPNGDADLQAWGIVQNLSGEDWKDVKLSLVAGAPLAFEADLGTPVIPDRPIVTDNGEVIAAVPKSETSLRQSPENAPVVNAAPAPDQQPKGGETETGDDWDGAPADATTRSADAPAKSANKKDRGIAHGIGAGGGGSGRLAGPSGKTASANGQTRYAPSSAAMNEPGQPPPPPAPRPQSISQPRSVNALAAVAVEGGTTRYDLPVTVTIPDKSATMVMLLSQRVAGEAIFLFAPDGGVPDSMSHPFRVARFTNGTKGVLERGPIAVF